jgi:methionyl-tRNA formyltransferase
VTDAPGDSRPRTIFLGSGQFGVESLRRLAADPEVELVGVVTAPARPAGRGGKVGITPIAAAAYDLALGTVLTPERLRSRETIGAILALEPELLVLVDYGRLVPTELLELPFGALNLHPSLLPRHRGASPIPAAILAGDAETGVTLMRMDSGLDTGPIVARTRVALSGRETAPALEGRLSREADALLARSLGLWIRGELPPVPQPDEGATLTKPLRREDGLLDVSQPAMLLERQVRAYQPWPGSFLETPSGRVIVRRATVTPGPADPPGRLIAGTDLRLATSDGWLILDEVQPAGKRPMSGLSYARGRPELRRGVS